MNFESINSPRVEVEPEFVGYIPEEFLADPAGYFEREGRNIKKGEIKRDEIGAVREDPTAVKDMPIWRNAEDQELHTVGRRVDTNKGKVGESGDPFYEYSILEEVLKRGLPAAKPVAKAEQGGTHIIIMERIPGLRWSEKNDLRLKERGYGDQDITDLLSEAEKKMDELKRRFDEAGISRSWKLKDMVFDIDIENKRIISLIPTDWERTTIKQ